jgi:porin
MIRQAALLLISISLTFSELVANDSTATQRSAQLEASYIADHLVNLKGGIKTGYAYLGMANFQLGLETEAARLWNGGEFYLHLAATHGCTPSATLIGDKQIVSNIEAGNHFYIQELWYRHSFENIDITLGLQDMNARFFNTETSQLLINSSFGVIPAISGNLPVSIFPLTTPGLTLQWNMSERSSIITAIHDGLPYDFDDNPYNLRWSLNKRDGALLAFEYQFLDSRENKKGKLSTGVVSRIARPYAGNPEEYRHRSVFYMKGDREIFQMAGKPFSLLWQAAFSTDPQANSVYSAGLGVHVSRPFSQKREDRLAIAFSHDVYNKLAEHETALELSYFYPISDKLEIQPDLQYIINPAGIGQNIPNSLIGILRISYSISCST